VRASIVIRIAAVGAAAAVLVALGAGPATAHTISGPRPTDYRSHIVAIAPVEPGVSARIVDLGNKFELTNRSSIEITVLGYEGEPYLRIGPAGIFENQHSQATYINRTRLGGTVPVGVDTSPTAVPQWKKIGSGQTARWHDHRIHWMSAQPPLLVAQSPGNAHHISQQSIVFLRDGVQVRIVVSLDWVPGPSGLPWIPAIAVLFVVGLLAALLPKWWRVLAALLIVLIAFDMLHAVAYEIPRPGGNLSKFVQFLGGSYVSIAVWIAAVPTILAIVRRRVEALYGVVFVALLIALIGGATDLSALWKSQLPDAGPHWLTRLGVVVALGLGAGLVVGAVVRMVRARAAEHEEGRGRWLSLLVEGLSDAELARIAGELDVDDVSDVAFSELAARAAPVADAFADGSLTFVVTDQPGAPAWSIIGSGADGLRAERGRVEPVAAEIHAPFAVMLQLLAGTVALADAIARALVTATGDRAFLATLAPMLSEVEALSVGSDDPAPAS
jgi:hypothetical protein